MRILLIARERERFLNDALRSVFFCSSSGLDEVGDRKQSKSFVFPPRMKKRQKQEYTPQLLFRSSLFLYLLSFPLIVFVKRAWYMVGTKGGGVLDTEQWRWEKKRQDRAQYTGKSSRGDVSRAALRAMDWPTLSSSYTLEDAKTRCRVLVSSKHFSKIARHNICSNCKMYLFNLEKKKVFKLHNVFIQIVSWICFYHLWRSLKIKLKTIKPTPAY